MTIAENLVSGNGYSEFELLTYFPAGHLIPTAARGPVPVFAVALLLLLFPQGIYSALFIYSWTLSSLTAVLLYFFAKDLLGSSKIAMAAALVFCFYLPEMFMASAYAAASEGLFTLLLMGYFCFLRRNLQAPRKQEAAAAGVLLALAFLCRPAVMFFPIFYIVAMIWKYRFRALPSLAVFVAAFLFISAPWAIRNQKVFHKPIFTTTLGGYNLFRHNGMLEKSEYRIYTSEDFEPLARKTVAESGERLEDLNEAQIDAIFKSAARKTILENPVAYLKLCARRFVWLWYKINVDKPPYIYLHILIYLFMFPGFILALKRRDFFSLIILHFLAFALFHAAINAQFRFICPMMPYGILMAVYTVFWISGRLNPVKEPPRGRLQ